MKVTRDVDIDRLRGILVILMVCGNYLAGIAFVPAFLKHAPDIGFTIADAVAPAFVFVMGLNLRQSLERRLASDKNGAYLQLISRYLILIGIGSVISAGATLVGNPTDWGVLQALGVAGLISLGFLTLPTWQRFVCGLALLLGYEILLQTSLMETVLASVHGGLFGSVSWGALLILSTAVADIWRRGIKPLLVIALVLSLVAVIAMSLVPVSKHRVSLSYVLISLAISALAFLILKFFSNLTRRQPGLLTWWGENALALYLLHLLLLAGFVSPGVNWWYADAPVWLASIQLLITLAILSAAAWWLHQRKERQS